MHDIFDTLPAMSFHDVGIPDQAPFHITAPGHGNGADHGFSGWLIAAPHISGEKHPHELNLELFEEEGDDHHD